MLNPRDDRSAAPIQRPPTSLRQEYQEFLLERIESYKNALSRAELLEIGDEAVRELEEIAAQQYLLTEVLLLEHVDRVIARRLKLPTFRRWAQQYRSLRQAQREPTHWGLSGSHPIVSWARRMEPGDGTIVVGAQALAEAMFLAAHDVDVFFLEQDLRAVEAAEQRAVTEQLGRRFQGLVIQYGSWFPDLLPTLAVIATAALGAARARERHSLVRDLQIRTRPGGVHVVLASGERPQVISLATGAIQNTYMEAGWEIERPRGKQGVAFVATKPMRQADTAARESK